MNIDIRIDGVPFAFRYCPAGQFVMGSPQSEYGRWNVEVQRLVELSEEFWTLETTVTIEQWKSVMNTDFFDQLEIARKTKELMKIAGNIESINQSLKRFSEGGLVLKEFRRPPSPSPRNASIFSSSSNRKVQPITNPLSDA